MSKACSDQDSSITTDPRRRSVRRRWIAATAAAILVAALPAYLYWNTSDGPTQTPIAGFAAPFVFGRFTVPLDNPLTEEAFQLGRRLFYDPVLSANNEVACATCHRQELAFTDGLARPRGLSGAPLAFSSMSLVNLLWGPQQFFWNGRAMSLEAQALIPIQHPEEMGQSLDALILELEGSRDYRRLFRRAYGDISADSVAKALATFMRLLISADSKYDRFLRGEAKLTALEEHGRKLFMAHPDVKVSLRGGNCIDCHSQFLTSGFRDARDGFSNNGLDDDANLAPGLAAVTGDPADRGKFKVPTLRNIAVTGPYMHDGRFETLADVLAHYNHGIRRSSTLSPLILEADNQVGDASRPLGLNLNEDETKAVIAFLHTLTDQAFLTNPRFSDPFERERQ